MSSSKKCQEEQQNACLPCESSKDTEKSASNMDIKIELIDEKDTDDVLKLLKEFFFKVRTMTKRNFKWLFKKMLYASFICLEQN